MRTSRRCSTGRFAIRSESSPAAPIFTFARGVEKLASSAEQLSRVFASNLWPGAQPISAEPRKFARFPSINHVVQVSLVSVAGGGACSRGRFWAGRKRWPWWSDGSEGRGDIPTHPAKRSEVRSRARIGMPSGAREGRVRPARGWDCVSGTSKHGHSTAWILRNRNGHLFIGSTSVFARLDSRGAP